MAHTILFSGHMIDKKGRLAPRFPASKAAAAGIAIRRALGKIVGTSGLAGAAAGPVRAEGAVGLAGMGGAAGPAGFRGIAAAACGGDILFHEACLALHIPSELYLGLPVNEFDKTSVSFAGEDWEERYRRLTNTLPVHILFPGETADADASIWEKANAWMLDAALAGGAANLTLIALWDGDKGDTGGTRHMVDVAKEQDAAIDIIDSHQL